MIRLKKPQDLYKSISFLIAIRNSGSEKKLKIASNQPKTISGIIRGQELDLFDMREKRKPSQQQVIDSYALKTGALFSHCCYSGGILGEADKNELSILENIGTDIGIFYQIKDDIKDKLSKEEEIGKPVGQDKDRWTLIDIVGLRRTKTIMEEYENKIKTNFGRLKNNSREISYLESVLCDMSNKKI